MILIQTKKNPQFLSSKTKDGSRSPPTTLDVYLMDDGHVVGAALVEVVTARNLLTDGRGLAVGNRGTCNALVWLVPEARKPATQESNR